MRRPSSQRRHVPAGKAEQGIDHHNGNDHHQCDLDDFLRRGRERKLLEQIPQHHDNDDRDCESDEKSDHGITNGMEVPVPRLGATVRGLRCRAGASSERDLGLCVLRML